jgi:ubiquinone biosynthesis protein COQ9
MYIKMDIYIIVYLVTLIFLTDFHDTWAFLDDRVKDAFDLKKTIQEVVSFSFLWCSISTYFGNFGLSWEGKVMWLLYCRQCIWQKLLVLEWGTLSKDL